MSAADTRKVMAAGAIGNVLEWYDFAIYGFFAAEIGRTFFPKADPVAQVLSAFGIFAIGVLFMIAFFAALRERLVAAEGGFGRLGALAFGAGVASAVFWIVAVVLFVAPALAANDTTLFHLDPNTYRLEQDAGYAFWVAAVMTGALVVWPTSAIAFRAPILPRWFAWVGVFVGIINLFALFFFPAFLVPGLRQRRR